MPHNDRAVLKRVSVSLPFGLGKMEWEADPAERRAAWSLYVEIVTRVAFQPLSPDDGLLREALQSLHSLFATTREILKDAGPDVGVERVSVGGIAIAVLNRGLRPFLTKWHPRLEAWETLRSQGESILEHERNWPHAAAMRQEMEALRSGMELYATALARIAGVEG